MEQRPNQQKENSIKKYLIEIVGWYGAIAIIVAYALNSFGYVASNGLPYQLLNFTGGIALAVLTNAKTAYQATLVNIIWSIVAGFALWQILG